MKHLPLLLLPFLLSCGYTRYAPPTTKEVTVDYVLRYDDGTGEVWAVWKSRYRATAKVYYLATWKGRPIPDSLKPGKKITLKFNNSGTDTCGCVWFRAMK